jgi:RimJ/RimL family protein N-acetyltransferase
MNLNLRPLTPADAELLFHWKNDPETRKNSGNTGVVAWEGHRNWVTGVVADPKGKVLRIAERNGVPVGLVRTALRDNGDVEVHYTVSPVYRGQGIGKAMVSSFIEFHVPNKTKLVLCIKQGNEKSEKIAQGLDLMPILGSAKITEEGEPPLIDWMLPGGMS